MKPAASGNPLALIFPADIMTIIRYVLLAFLLVGCADDSRTLEPSRDKEISKAGLSDSVDSDYGSRETPKKDSSVKLIVKHPTQYSEEFLKGLSAFEYSPSYELIGNVIIIGADTAEFPTEIPLHQQVHFKARDMERSYELTVLRDTYSSIKYDISILTGQGKKLFSESGIAHLRPGFFLGAETDEDDEGGYLSSEYTWSGPNCSLSIRIGQSNSDRLATKLTRHCNDKTSLDISLEDHPTLYAD